MRAERDRRATILTAEGVKQSQILTAEGEKQAAILRAEGNAQAAILNAEGEARAILQVFDAVHRGDADPKLLAYQYLQTLPKIAAYPSNKMWFLPSELTQRAGHVREGLRRSDRRTTTGGRPAGTSPLGDDLPPTTLTRPGRGARRGAARVGGRDGGRDELGHAQRRAVRPGRRARAAARRGSRPAADARAAGRRDGRRRAGRPRSSRARSPTVNT